MSILEKANNDIFNRNQTLTRIYQKIKDQERELTQLKVEKIVFSNTGNEMKDDFSIIFRLKHLLWYDLAEYWLYVTSPEAGNAKVYIYRYHPHHADAFYFSEVVKEKDVEDAIARVLLRYKEFG